MDYPHTRFYSNNFEKEGGKGEKRKAECLQWKGHTQYKNEFHEFGIELKSPELKEKSIGATRMTPNIYFPFWCHTAAYFCLCK